VDRKTVNSFVLFIFSAFLLREYVPSAVLYPQLCSNGAIYILLRKICPLTKVLGRCVPSDHIGKDGTVQNIRYLMRSIFR
jgi:hypothetical protein